MHILILTITLPCMYNMYLFVVLVTDIVEWLRQHLRFILLIIVFTSSFFCILFKPLKSLRLSKKWFENCSRVKVPSKTKNLPKLETISETNSIVQIVRSSQTFPLPIKNSTILLNTFTLSGSRWLWCFLSLVFRTKPSNVRWWRNERDLTRSEHHHKQSIHRMAVSRYKTRHYPLMKSIENGDGPHSLAKTTRPFSHDPGQHPGGQSSSSTIETEDRVVA